MSHNEVSFYRENSSHSDAIFLTPKRQQGVPAPASFPEGEAPYSPGPAPPSARGEGQAGPRVGDNSAPVSSVLPPRCALTSELWNRKSPGRSPGCRETGPVHFGQHPNLPGRSTASVTDGGRAGSRKRAGEARAEPSRPAQPARPPPRLRAAPQHVPPGRTQYRGAAGAGAAARARAGGFSWQRRVRGHVTLPPGHTHRRNPGRPASGRRHAAPRGLRAPARFLRPQKVTRQKKKKKNLK